MLQSYEGLCAYIEAKAGVSKDFPFDFDTLVYRVGKKMFVLMAWQDDPVRINLKCEPTEALALRTAYPAVMPGYHMHKDHWNSVVCDGSVPDAILRRMIDESYRLVVSGLSKAARLEIARSDAENGESLA